MVTDGGGNVTSTNEFYPYGQGPQPTASNHYLFSGKERDAESGGLDYFGARYYLSGIGRFMSADWSAQAEPVPYAKLDDPQTLNLYAYVRNNPISLVDPDGHAPPPMDWSFFGLYYPGPGLACNLSESERLKNQSTGDDAHQRRGMAFNAAQQQGAATESVIVGQRPLQNPILRFFFGHLFKHSYIRFTDYGDETHQMEVLGSYGSRRNQQVRDTYGTDRQSVGKEHLVYMTPEQKEALVDKLEQYAGTDGRPPLQCPMCGSFYRTLTFNSNSFVFNMLSQDPSGAVKPPGAPLFTPGYGPRDAEVY